MLAVKNLSATAGRVRLVEDVSFALGRGETLAILGASGSGKTLTGRALLALPPRGVGYGGAVEVMGENLLAQSERARTARRGRELAMVFQEPATALNPALRIGEQIAEPMRIHTGMGRAERADRVADLLARTGLAAQGIGPDRYPHQLSGGQRQRVAIAIAIALQPALIVADEPTSALDSVSARRVLDLMFALTAETGTALAIITHDIAVAQRAGRILVMAGGRVVEEGASAAVLATPRSVEGRALVAGSRLSLPPRGTLNGATVLEVEGLSVMRGGRTVVRDASLTVRRGERLAIVGRSGCGKTSLSRALVGLAPSRGTLRLEGETVAPSSRTLRRAVSMVFQDPATSFDPRQSVLQIVTEPLFGSGISRRERRERAEAILASVGLPDILHRRPHAFSGGQRQRIAIARALIAEPQVLIADEAVSALDAALRADVVRLLDDLTRQRGIALIFIAHDLALVRALADRIIVMDAGAIVETAATETLFSAPEHPAVRALLEAAA
ncbi:MAG: ABC transporter ATP-binding protein [Acuticoccus sp.]